MFNGKSILVTGGTGSFGKYFVKVLLNSFRPRRIVIYSRDELKQFEMQQEYSSSEMRYFIGDVRDKERLKLAMRGIDYVVHAAALKQVPIAEYNPMECIKTNVEGAQNVIAAALETRVKQVLALSTDKAANPINLYGASKLVSDKLFVAANNLTGGEYPMFSVVRYGNVIGSRGSVVPHFAKLLKNGAAHLPITDEKMTRFWISLSQGVDFVLQCFKRMKGGEIFVPKIPSIKIVDLARAMSSDIKLEIVGLRPGEKMHESLCPADEAHLTLEFQDYYVIQPAINFYTNIDYSFNAVGEGSKPVKFNFEYRSDNNNHFLSINEIKDLLMSKEKNEYCSNFASAL